MVGGAGAGFRLHSPHRLSTPLTAQPALMPPAVVHGLKLQLNGMCHLDTWCNLKAVKGLAAGSPPLCPCGEVLQPAPLPITEPQGLLKPESRAPAPSQLMELSHKPIPASRGHRATPPLAWCHQARLSQPCLCVLSPSTSPGGPSEAHGASSQQPAIGLSAQGRVRGGPHPHSAGAGIPPSPPG